jgi:hypothetical protein
MSRHTGMLQTCETTGKRAYSNRKTAKHATVRSARDFGEARSDWNSYRCGNCQLFHIGHRTPNYDTVYRIEEG